MKSFVILFAITCSILLTSCNSLQEITDSDKLSKIEQQQIIGRARKFISMVKHLRISKEDKRFVQENPPRSYIQYNGHKQGIAKILWRITPSYSIRIICKGDLLDEKCPTRMTVSRFQQ